MISELYVAILALVAGLITYFFLSKLIEKIPYNLMLSWKRQIEEEENSCIDINKFKVSFTLKIALSFVSIFIVAFVSVVSESDMKYLVFCFYFMVLVLILGINIKHQLLPDIIVIPMIWIGLIYHSFVGENVELFIYGAVVGYFIPFTINLGFKVVSGKEALGYGDYKMFSVLGAWFGIYMLPSLAILFFSFAMLNSIFGLFERSNLFSGTGSLYLIVSLYVFFLGPIL